MATWDFPNGTAETAKLSARLRGQNANRLCIRDPEWPLPLLVTVTHGDPCERGGPFARHYTRQRQALCVHCGEVVRDR